MYYNNREQEVMRLQKLATGKMPDIDRNGAMECIDYACHRLNYNHIGVQGHVACGHTLPVDGSRDGEIYHDLKIFMDKMDLKKMRADTKEWIANEVSSGNLVNWHDVRTQHLIDEQDC